MNGIIGQRISELREMPIEKAREHFALHCGDPTSELHNKCSAFMAAREAAIRDAREEESLSISRKALSNSERATRIAISAIVLSIAMATKVIIEWLSK